MNTEKVKLCWLKDGIKQTVEFNSIEDLQKRMANHLPNREWVEDADGNRLDIKIQYAK